MLSGIGLVLCKSDQVLICSPCQYALQPSGQTVSKHLWERHSLPAKDRAGLNAFVRGLDLPDPNTIASKQDGSEAHPHLGVQSGVVCLQCRYRTTSMNLLQRHLVKEHGQRKTYKGNDRGKDWVDVNLQSWSQNGKRKLWIVETPRDKGSQQLNLSPRRQKRLSQIHEAEKERATRRRRSIALNLREDPFLSSNWMRRTGWEKTFSDTDRLLLVRLTQSPVVHNGGLFLGQYHGQDIRSCEKDELRIQAVDRAVDRFFDRCEDTLQHTDHSIRCWLRSHFPGRAYKAPFEISGRRATRLRYRRIWKRMIYFCLRAHSVEESVRKDILCLPFSKKEKLETCRLWEAFTKDPDGAITGNGQINPPKGRAESSPLLAQEITMRAHRYSGVATGFHHGPSATPLSIIPTMPPDESGPHGDSEESDEMSDEYAQTSGTDRDETISDKDIYSEPDVDSVASRSGTKHQLDVASLTYGPKHIVGDPASDAIARFSVFLCTESFRDGASASTVMVYFAGVLGISQDGSTFERPSNYTSKLSALVHCARLCLLEATLPRFAHPRIGWNARQPFAQHKTLNKMREAFFCLGCPAPVGELISLRAYGRTVSRTDGPAFRVDWDDDGSRIKWDEGEITMTEFRALGHRAVDTIDESIAGFIGDFNPSLDLEQLRDRISELKHGYSFVQDPANDLNSAHIELSERVCTDPQQGLMTRNGWNVRSVRRFLKDEERLLESIMLMMYLRGGQAPRATELLSLECSNGSSAPRGIYVHNGSILFVTRHSKARRTTNQEFQVARYLPNRESTALATYLIYIRPVVDLVYRSCFDTDRDRKYLFSSIEDPATLWQISRFTRALRRLTQDVTGIGFGVQIYRQISIAVTERHVRQISSPFNRYDDKSADADVEVAFAWQSGHRPIQRGISYGIDAAFPDSLQPALLRVYKWASKEWHRFLDEQDPILTRTEGGNGLRSPSLKRPCDSSNFTQLKRMCFGESRNCGRERGGSSTSTAEFRLGSQEHAAPSVLEGTSHSTVSRSSSACQEAPAKAPLLTSQAPQIQRHAFESRPSLFNRAMEQPTEESTLRSNSSNSLMIDESQYADTSQRFVYLPEVKVLVCKKHGHAIRNLKRHLADFHTDAKIANALTVKECKKFEILAPEKIILPEPGQKPYSCLIPPVDAYQCNGMEEGCTFISVRRETVGRHWKTTHPPCVDIREEKPAKWRRVKVQSFCSVRQSPRWFIVNGSS
jgi:hypothetical protein